MVKILTFAFFVAVVLWGCVLFGHIDREIKNGPSTPAPGAVTDDGADEETDRGASDPSQSPGT